MAHPENCLNCYAELKDRDKFCYNCGQSVLNTHKRITMSHISHEVIHALTHADKGFFFLVKEMATQPGLTIKEFLAGKHKKFFNPFSFFFIVLGIYVLSNSFFKPFHSAVNMYNPQGTQVKYPAAIKTEKQRAKYDMIQGRVEKAMNFMNTRTNIVLCISTPFLAFIMFLVYRKQLFYAEHLVVMTFTNSFLNLLSIFVFTPLLFFFKGANATTGIYAAMLFSHLVYLSIVYHRVLDMPYKAAGYLKCFGAALIAMVCWSLLSVLTIMGYIFYGVIYH